jgi:hypothetical protein
MSEMKEVVETAENNEVMETENDDFAYYEDDNSGKVIALAVAGVAGAAALGVAAFKKLKAKADAKPRKKKHLKVMWVDDEEPDIVADVEATEVTDDEKSDETEE